MKPKHMNLKLKKIIYLALLLGIVILGIYLTWEFVIDDAYITYRYSENWAQSGKITWNPGDQPPVEGYTNFLWMALLAIGIKEGLSPIILSKVLGITAFLFILFQIKRTTILQSVSVRYFLLIMLVCMPQTYFHINSGLETMLYASLLLAIFLQLVLFSWGEKINLQALLAGCLLLPMIRPEGALMSLFALGVILSRQRDRKTIFWIIVLFLVPGLIYFTWRYWYFGYLLPNTFYVKFGNLQQGMIWLRKTALRLIPLFVILALLGKQAFQPGQQKQKSFLSIYLIVIVLCSIPYISSNLMMDYANRFFYHFLPVVVVGFGYLLEQLISSRTGNWTQTRLRWMQYGFYGLMFFALYRESHLKSLSLYSHNLIYCHQYLGEGLRALPIPKEYRTMAVGDAGAIPYFSQWNCLDYVGLNDRKIAHRSINPSDYLSERKPSLVLIYSDAHQDGTPGVKNFYLGQSSGKVLELLHDYEFVSPIQFYPKYQLSAYIRKDLPQEVRDTMFTGLKKTTIYSTEHTLEITRPNMLRYYYRRLRFLF